MDALPSTGKFARRLRGVATVAFATVVVAVAGGNYLRPAVTPQAEAQGPHLLPASQVGRGTVPLLPVPNPKRTAGLVEGGALSVLIEQFSGLNDQPAMRLKAFARITDAAVIRKLVDQLNALPAPPGLIHCPMDDGSYFALVFAYESGDRTTVTVDVGGCGFIDLDGAAQAVAWTMTSPALTNLLSALVAHPPGSY